MTYLHRKHGTSVKVTHNTNMNMSFTSNITVLLSDVYICAFLRMGDSKVFLLGLLNFLQNFQNMKKIDKPNQFSFPCI